MAITLPSSMKALEATGTGPVSSLKVVSNRAVPSLPDPTSGEGPAVIVKVQCAALNPIDWKMCELGVFINTWPHAFGCDMSGTVVAASEGADFKAGEKVWAYTLLGPPTSSTLAEYVRVPAAMLGHVPDAISMEAASTVGVGGLTAAIGLFKNLSLPATAAEGALPVLVYGASSTVGAFALSLLQAGGYEAIAVASKQHHAWLKDTLGAAQVVDYRDADWTDAVAAAPGNKGMVHALDAIGGDIPQTIHAALEKCGAAGAGKIATVDPFTLPECDSQLLPINIGSIVSREEIEDAGKYIKMLDGLLGSKKLMTMPTKVIGGLEEAVGGLEMLKAGKVRGEKLVVTI